MFELGGLEISYKSISIAIVLWFFCLVVCIYNAKNKDDKNILEERLQSNAGAISGKHSNRSNSVFTRVFNNTVTPLFESNQDNIFTKMGHILVPKPELVEKNLKIVDSSISVVEFIAIKVFSLLAGILSLLIGLILNKNIILILVGITGITICLLLDNQIYGDKIKKRNKAITKELPDFLNLLYSSCKAGHTTVEAIQKVSNKFPGVLSDEFKLALIKSKSNGGDLNKAIEGMIERNNNENLISVLSDLLISLEKGNNQIIETFKQEAELMRKETRIRIDKEGNEKSTILIFPMLIFFFAPAIATALIPLLFKFMITMGS